MSEIEENEYFDYMQCIWSDKCEDCDYGCDNFTSIDSIEQDIAYYEHILAENAEEYYGIQHDYSDYEE